MAEQTLAQRIKAKHPGAYDDMPDAELEAAMDKKFPGVYVDIPRTQAQRQPARAEAPYSPTAGIGAGQLLTEGVGRGLSRLGQGAQQVAVGGIPLPIPGASALLQMGAQKAFGTPAEVQARIDESKRLDQPLMQTTPGKIGNVLAIAAPAAAASIIPGVNTLVGSSLLGAGMGALEPTSAGDSRALNAALGGAGGAAGYGVGKGLEKGVQAISSAMGSPARQAARQSQNALRDVAGAEARGAGFTIPPSQTNPTLTNRLLEGAAGKIQTAQHSRKANEEVIQRLSAKAIGVNEVNPASVEAVRQKAGLVYETLKSQAPFRADAAFQTELAQIGQANKALAAEFPELAQGGVDKLVQSIASKPQFSADTTVEAIKRLRHDAKLLWRGSETSGDPGKAALAEAHGKLASALEGMIERNLAGTAPKLLPQFRQARELIAKTHAIDSAMNETTGMVSATALGKQLAAGAPLSGELAQIARASRAFPKATEPLHGQSVLPISPLDMYSMGTAGGLGAAGMALTGSPLAMVPLGMAAARPGIRAGILSRPFQQAFGTPSYAPLGSSTGRIARALAPGLGIGLPQLPQK